MSGVYDRFNIHAQLEHLQSKYQGTGHADTTKWYDELMSTFLVFSRVCCFTQNKASVYQAMGHKHSKRHSRFERGTLLTVRPRTRVFQDSMSCYFCFALGLVICLLLKILQWRG